MLSASTVFALGLLWAVVLLPRALKDVKASPVTTVTGFSDAMARLAVADQRLLVVPEGSGRSAVVHPGGRRVSLDVRRRRATLVWLLGGTVATIGVAAVVGGATAWTLAACALLTLVAYCVALRLRVRRLASLAAAASPPRSVVDDADPEADAEVEADAEHADAPAQRHVDAARHAEEDHGVAAHGQRRRSLAAVPSTPDPRPSTDHHPATDEPPAADERPARRRRPVHRPTITHRRPASDLRPASDRRQVPAERSVAERPVTERRDVAERTPVSRPVPAAAAAAVDGPPAHEQPGPTADRDRAETPATAAPAASERELRPIPIGVAARRARRYEDDGEPTGIWDRAAEERVLVADGR